MVVAIFMGVSGCGKTSISQAAAAKLSWEYVDADDFHPPSNKAKMASGVPLNDSDRMPWLDAVNERLRQKESQGISVCLACSALKDMYRTVLKRGLHSVVFVFLRGDAALIESRLRARTGHFMNPALLQSQFATLEEPAAGADCVVCNIAKEIDDVVADAVAGIQAALASQ